MKNLSAALAAHVAGETTTLCLCWKLTRADGVTYGFTDHDEDIAFDGTHFRAASALAASETKAELGLSVDGMEVAGALSADDLREEDLAAGRFDGAKLQVWLVNWADAGNPDMRVLLHTGTLGRVRRGEVHFEAEIRSLSAALEEVRGRLFTPTCDAELGDARCGVNIASSAFSGTGQVLGVDGARLRLSGLSGYAEGWFTHGHIEVITGAAAGFRAAVRHHRVAGAEVVLLLQAAPPAALAAGDEVRAVAGCDKTFPACRDKFANVVNFRGFPHMPGNDFVLAYPNKDDGFHDGGSMNL